MRTPKLPGPPGKIATPHQLSSSHYAIRRQAKRQLIAAGTAAVPAIKAALAGWTTPRMRWDMREVLSAIVEAQAIRGPMLTLKLAHAPLRIILKRLCRQANLTAQGGRKNNGSPAPAEPHQPYHAGQPGPRGHNPHRPAGFPASAAPLRPRGVGAALALRGTVRVYLSSDLRTLPINNLGFGHAAIQDQGMNLVFGKLKKIPGGWQIPLHISLIQGFFYHGKSRHWLAVAQIPIQARFTHHLFGGKELRFYSAKGRPLPITAHAGGNVASRGWGYYRYTMDVAGGKPTRAKIRFFTRTVLVKLPFNFQHLPIPR